MTLEIEVKNKSKWIRKSILKWAEDNLRDFPWRKDITPYKILIAEILLKRTTATAVNRIYTDFIMKYPDFQSLLGEDTKVLEEELESIGYNKQRAIILQDISKEITLDFDGSVPNDKESLIKIKHIGPYTAGAILSLGYNIPNPMVDSNVIRILSQFFCSSILEKKKRAQIDMIAQILVPENNHKDFNLALLDLGGKICTYRKTDCQNCPLKQKCDFARKNFSTKRNH